MTVKKLPLLLFISTLITSTYSINSLASVDNLPDIGTAAANTLSINQELVMGDFYSRELRGGAPIIYDPLLNQYVNQLGQRLVTGARSVKMPFSFYLLQNNQINAFAFFGGNVVIHSALFWETDDESQLASVIAHEISHVTQRHLARAMENQRQNAPLTWASAFGSMLLAMASPEAGIAALSTTMAGSQQSIISFTQSNEQEADRIGIQIMLNAGFNPYAMPEFMQKLSENYRYASKPPEMLLTHPLPDSRISDSRNRANQMKAKNVNSSLEYWLAKVRVLVMHDRSNNKKQRAQLIFNQLLQGDSNEKTAAQYGQALQQYQSRNYAEALKQLQPLLSQQPTNNWFIDLATDIYLEQKNYTKAINNLESALQRQKDNKVLQINLANTYLEANQATKANVILNRYAFDNPNDINGWILLEKVNADLNKRDEELAAKAEIMALLGNMDHAIELLSSSSSLVKAGSMQQARYDARIDQIRELKRRFTQYQR